MARGPKRNKYSGRKSGTAELATTGAATTIASYTRGRPRIGYTARGVSNYLEPSSGASINFGCISLPPLSVSTSPQRPFFPPFRLSLSPLFFQCGENGVSTRCRQIQRRLHVCIPRTRSLAFATTERMRAHTHTPVLAHARAYARTQIHTQPRGPGRGKRPFAKRWLSCRK